MDLQEPRPGSEPQLTPPHYVSGGILAPEADLALPEGIYTSWLFGPILWTTTVLQIGDR